MSFTRRPNARITIDGQALTAPEAGLLRLRAGLADDANHDRIELLVWADSKFAGSRVGAPMTVSLGQLDEEEDLFTGEVTAVVSRPDGVWIEGLAKTIALSRARIAKTFSEQSVGDIVRDLAGDLAEEVQADARLSAYSVDPQRPVWSWIADLSALTGAQLTTTAAGGLRFVPVSTGLADHTLHHGIELLSWEFSAGPAPRTEAIAATGSASEAGSEKWHWLRREPATNGDGVPRVVPAFHNKEAASGLAEALAARAARQAQRGVVVAHGQPTVRAGDLVELADVPASPGTVRVRRVEHHLDATTGFVSVLHFEGSGGGGLGALGGLL